MLPDHLLDRLRHDASERGLTLEAYLESLLDSDREARRVNDETQKLYRGIVDSSIDLVCRYNPDTIVVFANDAYCAYFGRTRDQIIGHSFLEYSDAENIADIRERIAELFADPRPSVRIFNNTHPNGQIRWIQWVDFGITDESGKVIEVQAVGRDITRLKEIEAELRQQEEHYRMLFESNPMPMWVYDIETFRYLAVNEATVLNYGYTREELLASHITDFMLPHEVHRLLSHLKTALKEPTSWRTEWQHRTKDGTPIDIEVSAHNFQFDGRPARLVLANDITTRKLLEEQRLYAKSLELDLEKEREIVELRDRFISLVSHEFRTPLAVIQSSVSILQRYYDRLERTNIIDRLGGIVNQVKRMVMMLDEVTAISRNTVRGAEFELEPIDLESFSQRILETLKILDEDQHTIAMHREPDVNSVKADPRLLEHILVNLLANSLKYSEPGTTVDLHISRSMAGTTFAIRDHGIGIPESDFPILFAPFHRGSNVGKVPGTGLGLSIVRQSVERLGGTINVTSKVGQGTQFTVLLPG